MGIKTVSLMKIQNEEPRKHGLVFGFDRLEEQ